YRCAGTVAGATTTTGKDARSGPPRPQAAACAAATGNWHELVESIATNLEQAPDQARDARALVVAHAGGWYRRLTGHRRHLLPAGGAYLHAARRGPRLPHPRLGRAGHLQPGRICLPRCPG